MRRTNKFEFYFQNQVLAVQRRLRDKQKNIVCRCSAAVAAAAAHNAVEVCVALFFLFCVNEYMVDHIIIIIIASYVLACVRAGRTAICRFLYMRRQSTHIIAEIILFLSSVRVMCTFKFIYIQIGVG